MSDNKNQSSALPWKELVWREIENPDSPEAYTSKEKAGFQPWCVVLKIELDFDIPEPVDYTVYLRAKDPHQAQYTAAGLFNILEHYHKGLGEDGYPMLSEHVPSIAYKLSEEDYFEAWRDAQKPAPGRHFVKSGPSINPTIFRFWEDGWDEPHSDGVKHGSATIIAPDMADIASINSLKARMDAKD